MFERSYVPDAGRANGSWTLSARIVNVSVGDSTVVATRSPASWRRAMSASSPATPPPAITTRCGAAGRWISVMPRRYASACAAPSAPLRDGRPAFSRMTDPVRRGQMGPSETKERPMPDSPRTSEHEAAPGDWVEVRGRPGYATRRGEILEVLGAPGHEHYRVRWDEQHESIFFPQTDGVHVHPARNE